MAHDEDLNQEFARLCDAEDKKQREQSVEDLLLAKHIDTTLKTFLKYLNEGLINDQMNAIEALVILEKRKFELIGIDPEEAEESEED